MTGFKVYIIIIFYIIYLFIIIIIMKLLNGCRITTLCYPSLKDIPIT